MYYRAYKNFIKKGRILSLWQAKHKEVSSWQAKHRGAVPKVLIIFYVFHICIYNHTSVNSYVIHLIRAYNVFKTMCFDNGIYISV